MPVYTIVERRPAVAVWEYIVEAETESKAMDKVLSRDPDEFEWEVHHTTEVDYELEAEYEVFIDEDEA